MAGAGTARAGRTRGGGDHRWMRADDRPSGCAGPGAGGAGNDLQPAPAAAAATLDAACATCSNSSLPSPAIFNQLLSVSIID